MNPPPQQDGDVEYVLSSEHSSETGAAFTTIVEDIANLPVATYPEKMTLTPRNIIIEFVLNSSSSTSLEIVIISSKFC